ncbi:MAG: RHS domain-containing protein [Nitrospirae bacterium]|nr:RHS domain-containing protein [Nitrospirota bacterium]
MKKFFLSALLADRLSGRTVPGVSTSYSYNADGWLAGIDAGSVMDYSYGFDNVGNITSKATEHGTYSYSYDALYRLTGSDNPALTDETFGYDKVGNRTASADAADWSYNQNNALVGYNGVSYTYDANGSTITKSVSGQVTAFAYDAKDRMEQVNLPDGRVASYKYDPFGRRISKDVDGVVTYFMYSDEGLAAEMATVGGTHGVVTKTYGWKPNPSTSLRAGSTWGTDPVFMVTGGAAYYYHNDHLGTPRKMTDGSGAVVWAATYTVFGKAVVSVEDVTNNLRFPGQYFDAETGLHYNFHRYYDPETGRYISSDPIGLWGGVNLFEYADNNTINNYDNEGLFSTADAIWHFFFGNGTTVILDFSEIDIGLQPRDFTGFDEMVNSLYKKEGTQSVHLEEVRNFGGWAGRLKYNLHGTINSNTCGWKFDGYVRVLDNRFDFNFEKWGQREYSNEVITRLIYYIFVSKLGNAAAGAAASLTNPAHLPIYIPTGQEYNIQITGQRIVTDGGIW